MTRDDPFEPSNDRLSASIFTMYVTTTFMYYDDVSTDF